jgi:hypothetical protein
MDAKTSLKTLKHVLELVERYKLDSVEFNGIKVTRSLHTQNLTQNQESQKYTDGKHKVNHSAQSLPLTVEDLDREAREIAGLSSEVFI